MDIKTSYLGLSLKNPLVAAPSPLSENVDDCRRLEDNGAAAIVLHSLFEEQIVTEEQTLQEMLSFGTQSYAEALTYFPAPNAFLRGPEEYLEHIRKVKKAVGVPVIGSLNGHTLGGWGEYAKHIEKAGADALELNVYLLPTDPKVTGAKIEEQYIEIVRSVKKKVKIPVSVKLSPYFSSVANMAKRLDDAGADGLVLFNRFYQPDIELEELEVAPNLKLSNAIDMRLPLRWVAILYGHVKASLAATSGVQTAEDALKVLMTGADVFMVCSALLRNGIPYAAKLLEEFTRWMESHEYQSVAQMKGSMSQKNCGNPAAFERANYMKTLLSYRRQG